MKFEQASGTMDNSLINHMNVDPEILAVEGLMIPMAAHISSQRAAMVAAHFPQAVVLNHATCPKIASGAEAKLGQYTFEEHEFPEHSTVQKIIPKFKNLHMTGGINSSIIIVSMEDSKTITYFELKKYTEKSGGFGYENIWTNHQLRREGATIPAGSRVNFSHAPNQDGEIYMPGIDMNVMYTTEWGTTEDAAIISEDKAKELEYTSVSSRSISIKADQLPLNIYGDDNEYKIFPDVGEKIREDGILIALRDTSDETMFIGDFSDQAMSPNTEDTRYIVEPGAEIVDVSVFLGNDFDSDKLRNRINPEVYEQLRKYEHQQVAHYKTIVETYYELASYGYTADNRFSNLVEQAMQMLIVANSHKISIKLNGPAKHQMSKLFKSRKSKSHALMDGKEYISFATVVIQMAKPVVPGMGFKVTGRDGAKCIISDVWPTHRMPVNETGDRVDLLIAGKGGCNRMNVGQFYEQFLTYAGKKVHEQIIKYNDKRLLSAYFEFLEDVWPPYAQLVKTQSVNREAELAEDIRNNGIQLVIYPYADIDMEELVRKLRDKYNIRKSKIKYLQKMHDGSLKEIITKGDFFIGSKYILLLDKYPLTQLSAVNLGYVSQFRLPCRVGESGSKKRDLLRHTPIRIGEDEVAMLVMSIGPEETARYMGLMADCPKAVEQISWHLLNDSHPTKLDRIEMSTNDVIRNSNRVKILNHQLAAIGVRLEGSGGVI